MANSYSGASFPSRMPGNLAEDQIRSIVSAVGFSIVEAVNVEPRPSRYVAVPSGLAAEVRNALERTFPRGLYFHQSVALDHLISGRDVCISTSTASGKSLIFMVAAADLLVRESTACVLALYPAKALIQDQLQKWKDFLRPFGLSPGYIDGAVVMEARERIIAEHRVVLMTPDVAHAWLMSRTSQASIRAFMARLQLLVLDEAHVYDGVFGTNMAYFIRRLLAASNTQRIVASTATIGEPAEYLTRLTGRVPELVAENDDGSPRPSKTVLLVQQEPSKSFDRTVALIRELATGSVGRFLAFADSRRLVEQLVAAYERSGAASESDDESTEEEKSQESSQVLPYRSGYEEEDRKAIQESLTLGTLAGVVSTSALELGLDIGEIDVVVLLDSPPTVKSFWQRLGRAGRKRSAVCVLIDTRGTVAARSDGLSGYMSRAVEPGWLYLENRYLQYTQALCAAHEIAGMGKVYDRSRLVALPDPFSAMLDNELNPVEAIPEDLYPLKQRGQAGPQLEFPVRTGIEKSYEVHEYLAGNRRRLGTLTFSQLLREGFPGAIYYYMARPYRVTEVKHRAGEVLVTRARRWTTRPTLQNMVFPRFQRILLGKKSASGFLVETDLQVSERVLGFVEKRGPNAQTHLYGVGSPYSQRPLQRMLDTTGVCWFFTEPSALTQALGEAIRDAFCALCGVESRDIGVGQFRSKSSTMWLTDCQGLCVYDATLGSLRLTQQLAARFEEVCELANRLARANPKADPVLKDGLERLIGLCRACEPIETLPSSLATESISTTSEVMQVISINQPAFLRDDVMREVQVLSFRFTPKGAMYQLESDRPGNTWMVPYELVVPIVGVTKLEELNLITGESRDIGLAQ